MNKMGQIFKQPLVILALGAVLAGGTALGAMQMGGKPTAYNFSQPKAVMAPAGLPSGEALTVLKQLDTTFADLAESVSDAVVHVKGADESDEGGSGSGFIYRSDGWIVTNDHVAGGRDSVTVVLHDGRELKGKVYTVNDDQLDIALVKIDASGLKTVQLADSETVRPGEFAMAVGSPFGLESTVTVGHVSAVNRPGAVRDPSSGIIRKYQGMIQTDASINPGNSGGPLFDVNGQVIGVNSTIFSFSGSSAGVGFAIPANTVKVVADEIIAKGKFDRGVLGIQFDQDIKPFKLKELGVSGGALAEAVSMDGPAFKAGLRDGDLITAVNEIPIRNQNDLLVEMYKKSPGDSVNVSFIRGKDQKTASIKLVGATDLAIGRQNQPAPKVKNNQNNQQIDPEEFFKNFNDPRFFRQDSPTNPQKSTPQDKTQKPRLGVQIEELSAPMRSQFKLPNDAKGVVVTSITPGSLADRFGMKIGDVLESLNGKAMNSPQDVINEMGNVAWGSKILVSFTRFENGSSVRQTIQVPFE